MARKKSSTRKKKARTTKKKARTTRKKARTTKARTTRKKARTTKARTTKKTARTTRKKARTTRKKARTTKAQGDVGRVVAKALTDASFKRRLLRNARAVLEEEGLEVPADVEVRALADTDTLIHLVVPVAPRFMTRPSRLRGALGCNCWQGEAWN